MPPSIVFAPPPPEIQSLPEPPRIDGSAAALPVIWSLPVPPSMTVAGVADAEASIVSSPSLPLSAPALLDCRVVADPAVERAAGVRAHRVVAGLAVERGAAVVGQHVVARAAVHDLADLAGGQRVGEGRAVHGLDVGQALRPKPVSLPLFEALSATVTGAVAAE